jgi:hypothetical protein
MLPGCDRGLHAYLLDAQVSQPLVDKAKFPLLIAFVFGSRTWDLSEGFWPRWTIDSWSVVICPDLALQGCAGSDAPNGESIILG